MSKHTPGPWFVVNIGADDEPMMSVKAARIAGQEPRHEVAICATGDSPQEMEDANARLIAAAPELLEALEKLHTALNSDPPDGGAQKDILPDTVVYRLDGQAMYLAINAVRAAIAKAKGE
jgi:hypothetical protein